MGCARMTESTPGRASGTFARRLLDIAVSLPDVARRKSRLADQAVIPSGKKYPEKAVKEPASIIITVIDVGLLVVVIPRRIRPDGVAPYGVALYRLGIIQEVGRNRIGRIILRRTQTYRKACDKR